MRVVQQVLTNINVLGLDVTLATAEAGNPTYILFYEPASEADSTGGGDYLRIEKNSLVKKVHCLVTASL